MICMVHWSIKNPNNLSWLFFYWHRIKNHFKREWCNFTFNYFLINVCKVINIYLCIFLFHKTQGIKKKSYSSDTKYLNQHDYMVRWSIKNPNNLSWHLFYWHLFKNNFKIEWCKFAFNYFSIHMSKVIIIYFYRFLFRKAYGILKFHIILKQNIKTDMIT